MPPPFKWDQLITNFLQQISVKKKNQKTKNPKTNNNNKKVTKNLEVKEKKGK